MDASERFELVEEGSGGGKIRNRGELAGSMDPDQASPGDFLSRLWALFGPPSLITGEGFDYYLKDRLTGLHFDAYLGASGPAYAGLPMQAAALLPVLEAFDALLDATSPVDCEIEIPGSYGKYLIGSSAGNPFEKQLKASSTALETTMRRAATIQQQANADPWEYCNALLELISVWSRLPDGVKARFTQEFQVLAPKLWTTAFVAIEEAIRRKYESGKADPTSETETLSEVALVQLKEVAEACGADWQTYESRYQALSGLATLVRSRPKE